MSLLDNGGKKRKFEGVAISHGFQLRGEGDTAISMDAVAAQIPTENIGTGNAEQSVCGLKAFLIDERREFPFADDLENRTEMIDCAKVAVLDITDSPIHVHGETLETYHVLEGEGRMVLGDRIVDVGPGSFIVIPPEVPHGMSASNSDKSVRVVMTFTPGLAPVAHQEFRDEQILHSSAKDYIRKNELV